MLSALHRGFGRPTLILILLLIVPFDLVLGAEKGTEDHKQKNKKDWLYHVLEANYLALNAADLVTTFRGVDQGAYEINPIARTFIQNKPLAIAAKTGLSLGVLVALREARKQDRRVAVIALAVLNVAYSVVVTNNIRVNLQLSR